MSYTSELKRELFETLPKNKEIADDIIAGIIIANAHFTFKKNQIDFEIHSDSPSFMRYFFRLVYKFYKVKGKLSYLDNKRFKKHRSYTLKYKNCRTLLEKTNCLRQQSGTYYSPILNRILNKSHAAKRSFLKGIFMSCGSMVNPEKSYYLEIDAPNEAVTETCAELLDNLGVEYGLKTRKKKLVLYLKESDSIIDFLGIIGAKRKYFDFENLRILKQMRGDINRKINFETANIDKTAKAASEQINSIVKLKETGRYKSLPTDLKEAAKLREKYPSISISKLAKKEECKMSRSTLHRRLKRIIEISNENE